MTDAYVRVRAKTLSDSFKFSAQALVNIMFDIDKIEKKQKISLYSEGHDLENLLFDWLEKILLIMLIDRIILSDFTINNISFNKELDKYVLVGFAEGEPIDLDKHDLKVEIKGITYHQMKIIEDSSNNEIIIEYLVDL